MKNKRRSDEFEVSVENRRIRVVLVKQKGGEHWTAKFWHDGRNYWRTTKTPNFAEAEAICKQSLVRDTIAGTHSGSLTLREAVDDCVAARWPTPATYDEHRKVTLLNLNAFAEHASPDTNLRTLTFDAARDRVQQFIDKRKKVVQPRTVLNEQRKLSRFFAWLIKGRKVSWTANPASMKFLEMPEVPTKVRPPVSPDELVKLIRAAKQTTIWPSVLLCLTTGLRPIGTLRIKWSDVNFETGKLRVFEKNRERLVTLDAWVLQELTAWQKTSPGENVVDLKDRTIHYWMNKIRTEQKLRPEATLQGCRRTFISIAMDKGVSAEVVASIAGNSVAVIEKHYKDLRTMNADSASSRVAGHLQALCDTKENQSKNQSKQAG